VKKIAVFTPFLILSFYLGASDSDIDSVDLAAAVNQKMRACYVPICARMFRLSEKKVSSFLVPMWPRTESNDLLRVELCIAVAARNLQEITRIVASRDHWSQRDIESALDQLNDPYGMVVEMVVRVEEVRASDNEKIIKLLRSVKAQK
jgi:hypothetical protein